METTLLILATLITIPAVVLGGELLLAQLPARRFSKSAQRSACLVLIPAHNEESGISRTVRNVLAQMQPGDRLVVVADNCTDLTAENARTAGAEVVERTNRELRGKGYALDHGLTFASVDPREVVVILDADCVLAPLALDHLVRQVAATGKPAQATYLMPVPMDANPRQQVSAFALRVKNSLRPRGLARLGLPSLLTGSGMAFPWTTLKSVRLATGNIVEDMQLGLDLAMAGHEPRLCGEALVQGDPAPHQNAEVSQRTRWEHGHLRTMFTQVPRLLANALTRGRLSSLALALELAVPPLTMFLGLLMIMFSITTAYALVWSGSWWPMIVVGAATLFIILTLLLTWVRFGRSDLPMKSLFGLPLYVLWKLPIGLTYFVAPQRKWVRTDRNGTTPSVPAS